MSALSITPLSAPRPCVIVLQVLDRMKAHPQLTKVPVAMLSGLEDQSLGKRKNTLEHDSITLSLVTGFVLHVIIAQ